MTRHYIAGDLNEACRAPSPRSGIDVQLGKSVDLLLIEDSSGRPRIDFIYSKEASSSRVLNPNEIIVARFDGVSRSAYLNLFGEYGYLSEEMVESSLTGKFSSEQILSQLETYFLEPKK